MQRFQAHQRVKQQRDFDRVYGSNVYAADKMLVMTAARNELDHTRLGLSVSRRVGNAVVRNRWKRLIREAFRRQQNRLPVGIDLVVRPRKGASPDYCSIEQSLRYLARRVGRRLESPE